jgi:hypothetical protein
MAEAEPAPCTRWMLVIPMLVNSVWSVCGIEWCLHSVSTLCSYWGSWWRHASIEHPTTYQDNQSHLPKTIDTLDKMYIYINVSANYVPNPTQQEVDNCLALISLFAPATARHRISLANTHISINQ